MCGVSNERFGRVWRQRHTHGAVDGTTCLEVFASLDIVQNPHSLVFKRR